MGIFPTKRFHNYLITYSEGVKSKNRVEEPAGVY